MICELQRAEFKAPQRGATDVRQGWSGEAAEPLLAKKKKIEPGATER